MQGGPRPADATSMRVFGIPAHDARGGAVRRAIGSALLAGILLVALAPTVSAAPNPTVTIGDVTVTEGNAGTTNAVFTIQVSPGPKPCCPLQISWATAPGTALSPADFTASSGTVSLSRSATSRTVTVPVVGDTIDEANETFVVNLSNLVGSPGTIGDAQAVGTISDNDPLPVVSIDDVTVTEGNSGTTTATFTISLSAASGRAVAVDWATTAGTATAGTDFAAASGSRTIAAGSTTATVGITVNGDTLDETDETFGMALSNPANATIGDGSGVGTITNDDDVPVLSVDDVAVTEGNAGTTTATFTISLSAGSGQAVTVDWATTAGTATAGTDFVAASGSRTIAAGSTTATVGITVNGDTLDETDETFEIVLSNPSNATVGDGSGTAGISDDDPMPTLSVADTSVTEGNVGTKAITFTVTLSAASGRTVTVQWVTADGDAVTPTDYASASGSLTFNPGQTSKTVTVTVNGDLIAELDEPFLVELSAPTNASVDDGQATGTIVDDELQPVIDLDAPSVTEGNAGTSALTFTLTLSHQSAPPVTVDWVTASGTATAGTDFLSDSGTVTFASMDTSETVTVTVNGDALYEHEETVTVQLSNSTNAPIGRPQRQGTIANDDAAPAVSVADRSVTEGDAGTTTLRFTLSTTTASGADATVEYATSDGTATAGGDYVAAGGTVTIPAGSTSATVDVTVEGDSAFEPDEDLVLDLSAPSDVTIGDGEAQGTIQNDDRMATSITLQVVRKARSVSAKGILEPTASGHRVAVTLYKRQGGKFVKVAAKTVRVKSLMDRDADGKTDGSYAASFSRPSAGGTYKVVAHFKGAAIYAPCTRSKRFRL
jgi:hypothetical protein